MAGGDPGAAAAARWLARRDPAPPAAVRASIAGAMARYDPGDGVVSERLVSAGLALLEGVVSGVGDRASAAELLAADALLTYAVEAAAEEGRGSLDRLLGSLDFDRFERLLPRGDVDR